MAKRQSKPFKVSAKLRKALSGFAASHEQSNKGMAAAMADAFKGFGGGNPKLSLDMTPLMPGQMIEIEDEAPPPPRQQKTRRPRDLVKAVVRELWPNGVPETETGKELLRQLGNELDRRGILAEATTLRRALGLRHD